MSHEAKECSSEWCTLHTEQGSALWEGARTLLKEMCATCEGDPGKCLCRDPGRLECFEANPPKGGE